MSELQLKDGGYLGKLIIGDATLDGHGQCLEFIVVSNVPIQDVVTVAQTIKPLTGVDFQEDFFRRHGDNRLTPEQLTRLEPFGIVRKNLIRFTDGGETNRDADGGMTFYDPEVLVYVWLKVIEYLNPHIKLKVLSLPYMNGRMIPRSSETFTMGYGLFDFWNY